MLNTAKIFQCSSAKRHTFLQHGERFGFSYLRHIPLCFSEFEWRRPHWNPNGQKLDVSSATCPNIVESRCLVRLFTTASFHSATRSCCAKSFWNTPKRVLTFVKTSRPFDSSFLSSKKNIYFALLRTHVTFHIPTIDLIIYVHVQLCL